MMLSAGWGPYSYGETVSMWRIMHGAAQGGTASSKRHMARSGSGGRLAEGEAGDRLPLPMDAAYQAGSPSWQKALIVSSSG
jgi:hypothetical protein